MSSKTLYVNNFLSWIATRFTWINDSGTWTKVRATWENNNGTWRAVQCALAVTSGSASGAASGAASFGLVSGSQNSPTTVTDSVGSISYSWVHVSTTSGPTPSITGATTAAPSWSATVSEGTPSSSSWRLTVTDATTGATATVLIAVTLTWTTTN